MAKLIATIKAVITRVLFGTHGFIAIWQVARNKENPMYWYLCLPIGLLVVEGLFTLAIKKNQEWRWFCPSVFLYLSSMVPAIWLLELDKIDRRLRFVEETGNLNLTALGADLKHLDKLLGVKIKLPDIQVDPSTWITLIEQFLMLILIIGRWMLPKGDLTRDQLSQLLLVYIGTAADIIEFFDSYKDNTIASEPLLVFLTLGIWSWSLLQFTIVLSATRSRKPRGGGTTSQEPESNDCCGGCCCSIDVWGIALNIVLQDAPFLAFRLLIILHYRIVTYMNVFFTCKNTLVILLQLYRLYVVHAESKIANANKLKLEAQKGHKKRKDLNEMNHFNDIYIISSGKLDKKKKKKKASACNYSDDDSDNEQQQQQLRRQQKDRKSKSTTKAASSSMRKDTGYSTASSSKSPDIDKKISSKHRHQDVAKSSSKQRRSNSEESRKEDKSSAKKRSVSESNLSRVNQKNTKSRHRRNKNDMQVFTEESDSSGDECRIAPAKVQMVNEKQTKRTKKSGGKNRQVSSSSSSSSSTSS